MISARSSKRFTGNDRPHGQEPVRDSKTRQQHSRPRRRSTGVLLPSLRILFRPTAGIGLDAHMPFNKHLRLYMSLESYFGGASTVRFGVEPIRFPFLRLQCSPDPLLSVRLPLLRFSEFNRLYMGSELTLFRNGQRPKINTTSFGNFWRGINKFVEPVAEMQRRASLGGILLSNNQRRALREALEQARLKRAVKMRDRQSKREQFLNKLDGNVSESADDGDVVRDLVEKMKHRYHQRMQLDREMDPPSLPEEEFGPVRTRSGDGQDVKDNG